MNSILVISPHPDDETLGCGGSLFRHKFEGDNLYWAIITEISEKAGWSTDDVKKRCDEIDTVGRKYGFKKIFKLGYPTTKIDSVPISDLINRIANKIYKKIEPEIIYMPFIHDVHSDHQLTAKALQATFKWFRHPYIKKVLMYETPSETEFNFLGSRAFRPNVFVNISQYLDYKIETMKIYVGEMGEFPFPRSEETIRSLATFRGSQCGYKAAEAFELVYESR